MYVACGRVGGFNHIKTTGKFQYTCQIAKRCLQVRYKSRDAINRVSTFVTLCWFKSPDLNPIFACLLTSGVDFMRSISIFSPFDFFLEKISPLFSSSSFLCEKQASGNPGVNRITFFAPSIFSLKKSLPCFPPPRFSLRNSPPEILGLRIHGKMSMA